MLTPAQRYAQEFRHLDRNADGGLDPNELGPKAFKAMDADKNGKVDAKEHAAYSAYIEDRFVKTGGELYEGGGVPLEDTHPMAKPLRDRDAANVWIEECEAAQRKLNARNVGDVAVDGLAFLGHCFLVPFALIYAGFAYAGGDTVGADEIFLPKRMRNLHDLKRLARQIPWYQDEVKAQWENTAS
jgi:hypothetical protein